MFPAPFDYVQPTTLDELLELKSVLGDQGQILAGGQSLIPLMKLRLAFPETLIDIGLLDELSYIRDESDHVAIGARTRLCDLERSPVIRHHAPSIARVASVVADPQVRHRGTIGGSLSHAHPAADLPTLLLALDAHVVVANSTGRRRIPLGEFFVGYMTTALGDEDVLIEVHVPKADRRWAYFKFNIRAQDWAVVAVAAVQADAGGAPTIALANVADTPVRAHHLESMLTEAPAAVLGLDGMDEDIRPAGDLIATSEHRRDLARVLTTRALDSIRKAEATLWVH